MVGRCGLEPQMYLTSRIYSPLPSPLGYLPIKREVAELFHNRVRIVDRRVMLMVFDRDTFVIHMLYFPHKFVGSLQKDKTHLATTCFGTLIHHPTAHIGTVGITYWDSNPYLPVLETGVLPIKLRLHIMAGRVRLELTTSRLTADCSAIELPTHTCQRTVRNLCAV